jgi:hypothetical protein
MNQLQFNGLNSSRLHRLNSIGMMSQLQLIFMTKSHLQLLTITTINPPLKPMLTMNLHQFNGLHTMRNPLLISTPTHTQFQEATVTIGHQSTATLKNHLHISATTTTTLPLNHILHMNHLQYNGLTGMNHQLLNSTHMFPSLSHMNMLLNHLHM